MRVRAGEGIEPASKTGKNGLNVAKGLEFLSIRRGSSGEEEVEKEGKWVPVQRGVGVCNIEQENGRKPVLFVITRRHANRIALSVTLQITLHSFLQSVACRVT